MENSSASQTAIHEAGHIVVRYLLYGNIDIIDYADIVPGEGALGRCKENGLKYKEMTEAFETEDNLSAEGGWAFKECCYSYAGVLAVNILTGGARGIWSSGFEDIESAENNFRMLQLSAGEIKDIEDRALPYTTKLIKTNTALIRRIADELLIKERMDRQEIEELLKL